MNRVFRHISMAPDEYVGRVEADGKVYETRFGPDRYIGRVELEDGRIYESRLGPDKYIGRVDLKTGKIYQARLGPDEYVGRVRKNGHCYMHKSMARDIYLGKVREMSSLAHGGPGLLLLLFPAMIEAQEDKKQAKEASNQVFSGDTGATSSD